MIADETLSEMEQHGAPQYLIDELKQEQVIEILPINWPIVLWFNEVCDLMHFTANGVCLGLDLVQVKAESELSQRTFNKNEFDGLRLMSKTVAKIINKVEA